MGKGTKISGLDTETIRQHIDNVDMTPRAMSQAIGDVINAATQPFQMDDNVIPLANYQKAGKHYSPNFTGDETTYFEMYPDEMTRLPRKWRNRVNMTLWKNPDNWTLDSGVVMRYVGDNTMKVTGFDNGAGTTVLSPDNLEAITGRTFCGQVEVWCDPADAGDAINIYYGRANGGSSVGSLLTVTLSVEKKTYHFDAWTGNASNIGDVFLIQQPSAGTAPVSLYFRIPHLEEVTNLSNQTSSQPVWGDDSKQELITDGTFSNDPEIPYVRFDGTSGNGFTMPAVDLSSITKFSMYFLVSLDDWADGTQRNFAGQYNSATNQRVITPLKTNTNVLNVVISTDGTSTDTLSFNSISGLANGQMYTFRIDIDLAGGSAEAFYSDKTDRARSSIKNWTSLGTDTPAITSLHAGTSLVTIGANQDNLSGTPMDGKLSYFELIPEGDDPVISFDAANFNGTYLIDADHNMFTPAARHDIEGEWTQTGAGTVEAQAAGQERVSNGAGTTTTGWTLEDAVNNSLAIAGGGFSLTGTNDFSAFTQSISVEPGFYRFSYEVTRASVSIHQFELKLDGSTITFTDGQNSGASITDTLTAGFVHYNRVFYVPSAGTLLLRPNQSNNVSEAVVYRNISVRPFALDGRTGYGKNTVLNAVKAPGRYVSGVELIENGGFDRAATEWTETVFGDAALSVTGGKYQIDTNTSGVNSYTRYNNVVTAGKAYRITATAEVTAGTGSAAVKVSGSTLINQIGVGATTQTVDFVAPDHYIELQAGTANGTVAEFDNVSVKEIIYDNKRATIQTGFDFTDFTDGSDGGGYIEILGDMINAVDAAGAVRYWNDGFSTQANHYYRLTVTGITGGCGVFAGTAQSASDIFTTSVTSGQELEYFFVAQSSTTYISLTDADSFSVKDLKIEEVDPNTWFRNDGLPTQGSNGKLELDRAGGGALQLQRPLDLSQYSPGDVLAITVTTEAQSNNVSLYFTESDASTTQQEFALTTAGRRVWYHVLTQADIDDTAFMSLGATGATTATATVLDVSIRKFTGSFTVLDDQDDTLNEAVWYVDTTIPTDNEEYVTTWKLSQGTSDKITINVAFSGTSTDINRWSYEWSTGTLAEVNDDSGTTSATASVDANGMLTIAMTTSDIAANTLLRTYIHAAADLNEQGSVNLHSVSLTGANWTPNGNLAINTDDWTPGSDCVFGIYNGKGYLINTDASASNASQNISTRSDVEYTVSMTGERVGISTNTAGSPDLLDLSGPSDSGTFEDPSAGSIVSLLSNNSTLGAVKEFTSVSLQESSYGLGTSRYMNNALVFGDGTVTYDEFSYLELGGTGGEYAQKTNPFTKQLDEIEVIAQVCPTIGTTISVVNQWAGGGNSAWMLRVTTSGFLQSLVSADGSTDVSSAATTALTSGQLVWVKWNFSVAAQVSNYYRSYDDPTLAPEAVANWASIGTDIAHAQTEIYQSTADIQVGARNSGGGSDPYDGLVGQILIKDNIDVPQETERFTPATAIANGWTVNSLGDAQIKHNTLIPLHRYEDEQLHDDYAVVPVPGRYKHFTTSESLEIGNARLPSLANATHPNGGGIYADVAALPNLLAPAARVDFTEWTQTGTGSITPVGDGANLLTSPDDLTDASWVAFNTSPPSVTANTITPTGGTGGGVRQDKTTVAGELLIFSAEVKGVFGEWFIHRIMSSAYSGIASKTVTFNGSWQTVSILGYAEGTTTRMIFDHVITSTCPSGFEVRNVKLWGEYSYTTLSDEDDTGGEAIWTTQLTIPSDNETYVYEWTYSPGTSTGDLGVRLRLSGGTAIDVQYGYNQSTGVLTEQINTNSLGVVTATANSDGTTTFRVQTTDTGANTTATLYLWQQGANVQGTFNVHGDVVIQRLSAQAEPAWNTLKPGDSVTNLVTNAQDFSTGWTDGLTSKAQDQTDMRGNANSAWTLTDNNAGGYASISQDNITISGETKYYCMTVPVKKVSSQQDYPQIRINTNNPIQNNNFDCDPYLGRTYNRGAGTEEYASGCIDGAWLQAMFPDVYPNASNYWIFYAVVYDDSGFTDIDAHISPAYSQTFGGSPVAASTGSIVVDSVTLHEGRFPYFFDSISTSAQVTEEIQDWSKIFTFLAEGSNNVANMVFTHGHHKLLGFENVTALTNEALTPYHLASAEANWTLSGTITSQTDVASVIAGEMANKVVGDGATNGGFTQDHAAALTGSAETLALLYEKPTSEASTPTVTLGIYDTTAVGYVIQANSNYLTGGTNIFSSTYGSSTNAGVIRLGVGPNGGDLALFWIQAVPTNSGNGRRLVIKPNGDSGNHDAGDATIVHAAWHVESDVVSILPFSGTRVAHSTWEYDNSVREDSEGTLVTDWIFPLDRDDMTIVGTDVLVAGNASVGGMLYFDTSGRTQTTDGTSGAVINDADCQSTDSMRYVSTWSAEANEQAIYASVDGDTEEGTQVYDGSLVDEPINLFKSFAFEGFLSSLRLTKVRQDGTERAATAEYHRND